MGVIWLQRENKDYSGLQLPSNSLLPSSLLPVHLVPQNLVSAGSAVDGSRANPTSECSPAEKCTTTSPAAFHLKMGIHSKIFPLPLQHICVCVLRISFHSVTKIFSEGLEKKVSSRSCLTKSTFSIIYLLFVLGLGP